MQNLHILHNNVASSSTRFMCCCHFLCFSISHSFAGSSQPYRFYSLREKKILWFADADTHIYTSHSSNELKISWLVVYARARATTQTREKYSLYGLALFGCHTCCFCMAFSASIHFATSNFSLRIQFYFFIFLRAHFFPSLSLSQHLQLVLLLLSACFLSSRFSLVVCTTLHRFYFPDSLISHAHFFFFVAKFYSLHVVVFHFVCFVPWLLIIQYIHLHCSVLILKC